MLKLHDYCCCGGLGADGYAAIFGASAIKGFDHEPQPDYPYQFEKSDVMAMLNQGLPSCDARHFSFPCQIHTTAGHLRTAQGGTSKYLDLLTPGLAIVRERYNNTPWVMENVDDRSGNVRRIMAPPRWRNAHHALRVHVRATSPTPPPVPRQLPPTPTRTNRPRRLRVARMPPRRRSPPAPTGAPSQSGCTTSPATRFPKAGTPLGTPSTAGKSWDHTGTLPWDKLKEGFPPAYTAWVGADLLAHLNRRTAS